jgi:hypothetical protein
MTCCALYFGAARSKEQPQGAERFEAILHHEGEWILEYMKVPWQLFVFSLEDLQLEIRLINLSARLVTRVLRRCWCNTITMHLSTLLFVAALCANQALATPHGVHDLHSWAAKFMASKLYIGVPNVGPSSHAVKIHQKINKTHMLPKNGTLPHEHLPKVEKPAINGTHPHDVKAPEISKANTTQGLPANGTHPPVKASEAPKPNTPILLPTNATKLHDSKPNGKDHKPSPAPAPPGKAHPRDFLFAF